MTRILLVYQPVDGGVARHVADLCDGLSDAGHDVVLCGPAIPSASTLSRSVSADAHHVPLEMWRGIDPRAELTALSEFSRIVRALKPDVIHAHSSKAGAIARLGKLMHPRIPVLYTPHGYAFAGFFERELERRAYREAERIMARLTQCVIAVCDAEAQLAASVGPVDRIQVVHNGIEPNGSGPADPYIRELATRGPVVCTLTQLRPGKGVETLIDALPSVVAHHPRAQIAIAGDGPLRSDLVRRTHELGLGDSVHFLGEHGDPLGVLRGADVFLMTSWAEAFPYVILEAMSIGLPIVSSDVGGVSEAIEDGETGLLVGVRNAPATARALDRLLGDDGLRARLGDTARHVVREHFTRREMVEGVARIYENQLVLR